MKLFVVAYFIFGGPVHGMFISRDHMQISQNLCQHYIYEAFHERNLDRQGNQTWFAECIPAPK